MLTFDRLRNFSLLAAFAAAPIPLFIYITAEHANWLWLLIGVNIFAYLMVALTTIRITLDVAQREKQKSYVPAKWADNPTLSKWYTAVRLSRKWHVLAAVARIGLVLGVVEWLRTMPMQDLMYCLSTIARPYCYNSGKTPVSLLNETVFIAICVQFLFSQAETRLLSALVLLLYKFIKKGTVFVTLYLRLHLTAFFVLTVLWWSFRGVNADSLDYATRITQNRVITTVYTGIFTFFDNSVLLSANIMRPLTEFFWDTRPFVARNIVAGLLGLLLYAGLTRGLLWLAQKPEEKSAFD
jgi:hypothetical protein